MWQIPKLFCYPPLLHTIIPFLVSDPVSVSVPVPISATAVVSVSAPFLAPDLRSFIHHLPVFRSCFTPSTPSSFNPRPRPHPRPRLCPRPRSCLTFLCSLTSFPFSFPAPSLSLSTFLFPSPPAPAPRSSSRFLPRVCFRPRFCPLVCPYLHVRTPGLANGAVGCPQDPLPVYRYADARGMKVLPVT